MSHSPFSSLARSAASNMPKYTTPPSFDASRRLQRDHLIKAVIT
jgi:hypothetical protein